MQWLDGAGRTSTLYEWLFESRVHEVLLQGGTFQCTLLNDANAVEVANLQIDSTLRRYERLENDFTLEMIFYNVYHIPKSQPFTNEQVIMFQIAKEPGIGVNRQAKLREKEIRTCEELWEARYHGIFFTEAECFETFKAKVEMVRDVSFLNAISQLLLEIETEILPV